MVRQFYNFLRGRAAGGMGAGADGFGLKQPQTLPLHDGYNVPGYAIVRSLGPIAGGFNYVVQTGPDVDLQGNGLGGYTQMQLQRLAQLQKAGN